jgi:hypothetical protein
MQIKKCQHKKTNPIKADETRLFAQVIYSHTFKQCNQTPQRQRNFDYFLFLFLPKYTSLCVDGTGGSLSFASITARNAPVATCQDVLDGTAKGGKTTRTSSTLRPSPGRYTHLQ